MPAALCSRRVQTGDFLLRGCTWVSAWSATCCGRAGAHPCPPALAGVPGSLFLLRDQRSSRPQPSLCPPPPDTHLTAHPEPGAAEQAAPPGSHVCGKLNSYKSELRGSGASPLALITSCSRASSARHRAHWPKPAAFIIDVNASFCGSVAARSHHQDAAREPWRPRARRELRLPPGRAVRLAASLILSTALEVG